MRPPETLLWKTRATRGSPFPFVLRASARIFCPTTTRAEARTTNEGRHVLRGIHLGMDNGQTAAATLKQPAHPNRMVGASEPSPDAADNFVRRHIGPSGD